MHVLLIKMSSLGDVIHTLPALTDALHAIPDLEIDWVVEPGFSDIPSWHPAVKKVIPIALRHWRKNIFQSTQSGDIQKFYRTLREKKYDAVIDAQGLLKSTLITKIAHGPSHGLDKDSARESLSSYFYNHRYAVEKNNHAITRTRMLFAKTLQYNLPNTAPDYFIDPKKLPALDLNTTNPYLVFLHGTTWTTKHYPEIYWRTLAEKANAEGITVYLPWGNSAEQARAKRLAADLNHVVVLPRFSINQMARLLHGAKAVISNDTGLGHLSAALNTKTIGLYGPTDTKLVGMVGSNQINLSAQFPCAPCHLKQCAYAKKHKTDIVPACYTDISPDTVWKTINN